MLEQHGTHVCRNCGKEFSWSVFIRKEYVEPEMTITAKCLCCGEKQKWTQKMKERVAKRETEFPAFLFSLLLCFERKRAGNLLPSPLFFAVQL